MKVYRYQLQLVDPFGIARSTRTHSDIVLVNYDGGWGESAPSKFYGEDCDSVVAALESLGALDLGDLDYLEDVFAAIDAKLPRDAHAQSAKAALDIALHDRAAQRMGVPLYRVFGKNPAKRMVTSFTIGIDTIETMMAKVERAQSYDILKIKLGRDVDADMEVMRAIRKAAPAKTLRVDANAGWSLDEAKRACNVMADLGVEFVEQPLAKGNHEELRTLTEQSPVKIFVDEDSMIAADLPGLVGRVHGINIKLMKTGGLVEARRMVALGRALGFEIMLGCMIETSVGITAAAHLAPFVDYIDLDGSLLTSNDPFTGATFEPNGTMHLPTGPGLGVVLKPGVELSTA